ncbi:FAD/NAD-P-binding domain-containing protein [Roridomyces roridus]|uniref:FAD/NAD-P-binding domain-containing protein n=1 Tax=Roridomyces roridus TaxID=1738132 RepID=A0AAD7BPG2_9AGAR|nr:FAD/NAD-P-binding domain-containing protein [Roridomyces roridus]
MVSLQPDTTAIASAWLEEFSTALTAGDAGATAECFLEAGYLRDVLVFTWRNRTLSGRARIAAYLNDTLKTVAVRDTALDTRPYLTPELGPVTHVAAGVSSGFTFETTVGPGQGYFSLVMDAAVGEWKALMVFMTLTDIRGHEESGAETGVYGGHTLAWHDVHRLRRNEIERNPHVLIIGAGQTGLNVGARFKQMNIPTLIVDANPRVGDNWRQRYPTLTLHTIKTHHTMLYQAYPDNWPIYTPRDKLADWLEHYAISQDLVIWTNSHPLPTPQYDPTSKRWTVLIDHAGSLVTLNPAHIVIAAGTAGRPYTPSIPSSSLFSGTILHAAAYPGGQPFIGLRTLVVGAGNSSADICQDLAFQGAKEVTMLQRSATCVVSSANVAKKLEAIWPANVPTEIADFKAQAEPYLLLRKIGSASTEEMWEEERETHRGLREAGLKLTMGEDGSGQYPMIFERFGGYWLDVGVADQIRSGRVKIKQGVEIARFTEDSVIFTDGTSLQVDVVIYATSYESVRDTMRGLFGDETIDQTSVVWGTDDEGELNGCFCPSGHPGLWFAAGDFGISRFYSKQLALEIKAIELGLLVL